MSIPLNYVMVFGGTGFIGSRVVAQLLRFGPGCPWDSVMVLVRTEVGAERVRALGAEPVLGDLMQPRREWQEIAKHASYIAHCAQPPVGKNYATRGEMEQILLDALDPATLKRGVFVYGSSYFGISEQEAWVDEESRRRPVGIGPYFEPSVRTLQEAGTKGLDYVAAFPGGVYGRGSWFLELYLDAISKGQPILMCQPPRVWTYVHVDDCARAIVHLLTVERQLLQTHGREVIVVDDNPIPIEAFLQHLGEVVGRQPRVLSLDEAALQQKLPPIVFAYQTANMRHSNARLKRLGFRLRYPHAREGLASLGLPTLTGETEHSVAREGLR